jgi:hypothetical protein
MVAKFASTNQVHISLKFFFKMCALLCRNQAALCRYNTVLLFAGLRQSWNRPDTVFQARKEQYD